MSYTVPMRPRYGLFYDVTDQTGSTTVPTAVKFGSNQIADQGVTVVTDGTNLTRVTFGSAGTYLLSGNLQTSNSDAADHNITVWVRFNGVDLPNSSLREVTPKLADGGLGFISVTSILPVAAGDYIQVVWLVDNVALTLDYTAAAAGPPAIPARASARIYATRISL